MLGRIPALRMCGEDVYIKKSARAGHFSAIIWRGELAFTSWVRPKTPPIPKNPLPR